MKIPFLLFAFLLTISLFKSLNTDDKGSFESLIGEWEGKGILMGNSATFKMTWKKGILHEDIYELVFQNSFENNSGGTFEMNARGTYQSQKNIGYWIDSRGEVLKLKFEWVKNSLIVRWGDPSSEEGRTTYTVIDDANIAVLDEVLKEGQYYKFAEAKYRKNKKIE